MAVIGQAKVNTLGQFQPSNAPLRANTINGVSMANTIGSLPLDQAMGLQKQLENLLYLQESFSSDFLLGREESNWRWIFSPFTLPQNQGTLSATFRKYGDMDDSPETASVKGLEGYDASLNEVSIDGYAIQVSTAAYGRYAKNHRIYDQISAIPWANQMAQKFASNAVRTMDNLAGVRAYEGASKLYVQTVDPYDDSSLDAALSPRVTLGATLNDVAAPLSWDSLNIAKWLMSNYQEVYTKVNQTTGDKEEAKRIRSIATYNNSGSYLVVVSNNGYNQLLNDPHFQKTWIEWNSVLALEASKRELGVSSPFNEFLFKKTNRVLTVQKATGHILTDGTGDLEVAFVIGGGDAVIGVELTLEGSTESFSVGYNEDRKTDPLGLLSFYGWITITDFTIVHSECIYAIPYATKSPIKTGQASKPTSPTWKK